MLLRLSYKLAKKLHQTDPLPPAPPEKDPYADWYAHLFCFERARYIIAINSAFLFTVVFQGKDVTSLSAFMQRFIANPGGLCAGIKAGRIRAWEAFVGAVWDEGKRKAVFPEGGVELS